MKAVYSIVLLMLLSSCKEHVGLKGVWISVSSFEKGAKPSQKYSQYLYDFETDSLVIVELGNHASGDYGEINIDKYPYKISNNQINVYSENDTLQFSFLLKDSLILSTYISDQNLNHSIVCKRLDLSKNLSQTLKGSYQVKWPEDSSSLSFVNDSICVGLNENQGVKWKVFNYKGGDLFMYQDYLTPIASIWDEGSDTINLTYHYRPSRIVTMNRVNKSATKEHFYGEWNKYRDTSLPPPPPPPGAENFKPIMSIDFDTLSIHYFNGTVNKYWKLTDDGKYIYFPDNIMKSGGCWIVESIQSDSITLITGRNKKEIWFRSSSGTDD